MTTKQIPSQYRKLYKRVSLPGTPEWAPIREIAQILANQLGPCHPRLPPPEDASEMAYYERLRAQVAAMPPDPEFDAAFAAEQAQRLAWIRTEVETETDQEAAGVVALLGRRLNRERM